jgi:hypothetical protein
LGIAQNREAGPLRDVLAGSIKGKRAWAQSVNAAMREEGEESLRRAAEAAKTKIARKPTHHETMLIRQNQEAKRYGMKIPYPHLEGLSSYLTDIIWFEEEKYVTIKPNESTMLRFKKKKGKLDPDSMKKYKKEGSEWVEESVEEPTKD